MVEIKEVTSKKDLKKFATFPIKMYKDVPEFVPGFVNDDIADWTKKNPAMAYCESKVFLAYKDGKLVGRIGAILSHEANRKWNQNRMRFSQVDFIDDEEVSKALFDAVEKYAKEKGCSEVHGPLGFTDMDREGMLVEGFEEKNMWITYYNYPYYNTHLEKLGYAKSTDWIERRIFLPEENDEKYLRLQKISNYVLRKNNLHVFQAKSRKDFTVDLVKDVFRLLNICYANLYGTVDLTDKQINMYAKKFIPLLNPKVVSFIYNDKNEMVAFGISSLGFEDALKKAKGKLFPFGFIGILKQLNKSEQLDLFLIAVHPDYQKMGVNAALMTEVIKGAKECGVKFAETGPNLETNDNILNQWEQFNYKIHKRRRCYIKQI